MDKTTTFGHSEKGHKVESKDVETFQVWVFSSIKVFYRQAKVNAFKQQCQLKESALHHPNAEEVSGAHGNFFGNLNL